MLSRKLFLEVAKVINLPLELTKRLSDNRENGMGGLLFPVLDKEKSFHAILGLEWGVCAWIWSWPGMTKGVSIGTVPFRFLLAALELLISTPHSLVYFLLSVFESLLLRARFLEQTSFLIWEVVKYAHTVAYIGHSGSQNQGEGYLRKEFCRKWRVLVGDGWRAIWMHFIQL